MKKRKRKEKKIKNEKEADHVIPGQGHVHHGHQGQGQLHLDIETVAQAQASSPSTTIGPASEDKRSEIGDHYQIFNRELIQFIFHQNGLINLLQSLIKNKPKI